MSKSPPARRPARRGRYCYPFPRPMVTVDVAAFRLRRGRREVLLIRRANAPFRGKWALPGGFLEMDETLEACGRREFREETGLAAGKLELLGLFDRPGRDPRGRVVTATYLTFLAGGEPQAGDDAARAAWHPLGRLPSLAFDHQEMLRRARARRRGRARRPG